VFPRISHICQPDSKESLGPPEFIGTRKNETPTSILQLKHKPAYACALLKYNPNLAGSITLLENIADASLDKIGNFEPQGISNMLWTYATLKVSNPQLFQVVGDSIVGSDSFLNDFNSQNIANTVWAYATLDERYPALFKKMGDHIVDLNDLSLFNPQELANILWAYASLDVQHLAFFKKIGDHILHLNDLSSFKPQNIANIVWAYAKARVKHTNLFKKMGDHIVMLDSLKSFNSQSLSNIAWAYATANELRTDSFESIGAATFERGHLESFNAQNLSNIAWSFAVADVDIPLFREGNFGKALHDKKQDFNAAHLRQLYQWHLWQTHEKSNAGLPGVLVECCHSTFVNSDNKLSSFQKNVISELAFVGLNSVEKYLTLSGYKLDALVQINDTKIGIEIDGPHDFIGGKPIGGTLLKRRQVMAIDKIPLVIVSRWKWDKLDGDRSRHQQYLQSILKVNDMNTPLEKHHEADSTSFDEEISSDLDTPCITIEVLDQEPVKHESEDLEALTVPELKEMLRRKGLKVGGRKAELIERLELMN
jgi:hypothetical protein